MTTHNTDHNKAKYDAFLSYSSKDIKYARLIQKHIENYKPPKGLVERKTKLKIFRDKDDQGLSKDYEASFNKWIDITPGFLLIGSNNSLNSKAVNHEVNQFIKKDEQNICLAWIDNKMNPKFHDIIIEKYPNALFADFRMLKSSNYLSWLIKDKKLFKIEALRIIASLLSQRTDQNIALDQLIRREKQRAIKHKLMTLSIVILLPLLLSIYLLSTPQYAWQHTELMTKVISSYQLRMINNKPRIWITSEVRQRWEDDSTAESGYDSKVNLYQLNEYGEIEGELAYATCGVDRYLCEDPERFGVFAKLNEKEILNIINKDYANENDSLINYEINADQFYKVSFATSPTNNGVIFMSSVKDTYPYGPKKGGIYRSLDYGKNWTELNFYSWDSFSDIIYDINSINTYSIILTQNVGTFEFPFDNPSLLPSVWSTFDDGITWKQIKSNRQNIDIANLDLIWMTGTGNLLGTIPRNDDSKQLIIFKKRSIIDRFLRVFDDF